MEEQINFNEACRHIGLLYLEMQVKFDRQFALMQNRITQLEHENAELKAKLDNDTSR